MQSTIYPWKRFWCPISGSINLSYDGYLYDPDSTHAEIFSPDVKPFAAIAKQSVLGLLGEPGIGKSFSIEKLVEETRKELSAKNGHVLYLNLNAYSSEERLERKLFGSNEFQTWLADKTPLHIFLDSFDECLLSIPTLSRLLEEELKKFSTANLFLRIACRTHDWPNGLEEFLKTHWGNENVGIYELTPLRQVDVVASANLNGIDPTKFIEEISRQEVQSFAIKPITLNMLINIFKKDGDFPESKSELYRKGCLSLAEESNISRQDAKRFGNLSPTQRLVVASRIAALMVLGGRNAIWTGSLANETSEGELALSELTGGYETIDGTDMKVTESALREVISCTGFFTSRGSYRVGWAHQTYAEYLTAYYLIHCNVTTEKSLKLLCHPEDDERKLIPQLTQAATWLASMNTDVFMHIMSVDPETLLKGDFANLGELTKKSFVKELLTLYESGDAVDNAWELNDYYYKLAHSDLTDQLKPFINDTTKNLIVRRVAIDIAEACKLKSLQEELLFTALNQNENYHIRSQAVNAICLIGDEQAKLALVPLAFGACGPDPDDQLKAQALRVLWPNFITAEDLFLHLTPPQNKNMIGAYVDFLSRGLFQGLNANNIVIALNWIRANYFEWERSHRRTETAKGILKKAWQYLETKEIAETFAKTITELTQKHETELLRESNSTEEKDKRYILINTLLSGPEENLPEVWVFSQVNLITPEDIPWLINQSQGKPKRLRQYLAELTERVYDFNPCHTEIIFSLCVHDPTFANVFKKYRDPILLNSPEADRLRRLFHHERERISPSPMVWIYKNLDEFDAGNPDVWPKLILNMNVNEYRDSQWPSSDYKKSPGWQNASLETRLRIVLAAKEYLINGTPQIDSLFEQSTKFIALAPDYALRLLYHEDRDFVQTLPNKTWGKWAAVPLYSSSFNDKEETKALLQLAYKSTPEKVTEGVLKKIDGAKNNQFIYLECIEPIWDVHLSEAIFKKLSSDTFSAEIEGSLLGYLLKQGFKDALAPTESLVTNYPSLNTQELTRAVLAATNLMLYAPEAGWSVVWPLIETDANFARELVKSISGKKMIISRLSDSQATDLYIHLEKNYPQPRNINTRDDVREFKEDLFRHLKARGTSGACMGLEKIISIFPAQHWFKWALRECRSLYLKSTWVPPTIDQILTFVKNSELQLVRNGSELLEVIMSSLKRLEQTLQGVTPMARFLWNENGGKSRPKSENDFSDYVENHLREDLKQRGIIANREVEFRRLKQSGVGEKVDIVVDAVSKNGEKLEPVSVVIESKGCWNKDLKTAMENQLRNRYLIDDQHRYGLYLIGWFLCDKWDNEHYQKKDTLSLKLPLEEARTFFTNQASDLSNEQIILKAFVLNATLP